MRGSRWSCPARAHGRAPPTRRDAGEGRRCLARGAQTSPKSAPTKVTWDGDSCPPFSGGRRPCRAIPETRALQGSPPPTCVAHATTKGPPEDEGTAHLEGSPECPRRRGAATHCHLCAFTARLRPSTGHAGLAPCWRRERPPGSRRGRGRQRDELPGTARSPSGRGPRGAEGGVAS